MITLIRHDIVNINLLKRPEFIFLKNPDGKVPIIETNDGKVLYESLVVSYYMDEAYDNNQLDKSAGDSNPVRKLAHTHPYSRASDRLLLEKFTKASRFTLTTARNFYPKSSQKSNHNHDRV